MSIEYEFWNHNNTSFIYGRFQQITNRVHDIKTIANYTLKSEIYLAKFEDANPVGTAVLSSVIANFIDAIDANSVLNYDRIMLTYYTNNPVGSYTAHNNPRLSLLDASLSTTNSATEIYPLFSTYLPSGDPNFGKWINENSKANIFLAEREYYEDCYSNPLQQQQSNVFYTCHNMWYRSLEQAFSSRPPSVTIPNPNAAIPKEYDLIYVDGPICTLNTGAFPTFTYSGPCESGIMVRAYAVHTDGTVKNIYGTPTTFIQTAALTNANSYKALPDFIPATNMAVGEYAIHAELSYDGGATVAYSAPIKYLQIVNTVNALTPQLKNVNGVTEFCEGAPLILRAPNSTANWYLNGVLVASAQREFATVATALAAGGTSQTMIYSFTTTANSTCPAGTSLGLNLTVFKNPAIPVISTISNNSNCDNTAELGFAAGNIGCTYIWNNGSTGNSITVSKNQVYRVLQVTAEGCQRFDSERATFNYGCDNAELNLCTNTIFPTSQTIQNFTGSTISLQNNYTLPILPSATTVLTGVTINGASNTQLIVPSGSTLKLYGCTLSSCSNSWGGILVEDGGRIETYADANNKPTIIENALTGIELETNTQYNLENTIFNRCETSLKLIDNSTAGNIIDCEFNCLSNAGLPTGLKTDLNVISKGIVASNSFLKLSAGVIGNKFNHLKNAITTTGNSNVIILGSNFNDIKNPSTPGTTKAIDISAGNSSFAIRNSTFTNCETSIYTANTITEIKNNVFDNILAAIYIQSPSTKDVIIESNIVTNCSNSAIDLNDVGNAHKIMVRFNNLSVGLTAPISGTTSYGIRMSTLVNPILTKGNGSIAYNTINLKTFGEAISVSTKDYAFITGNTITLHNSSNSDQKGIAVMGGKNAVVNCNYVNSNQVTSWPQNYGYYFSTAQDAILVCNTSLQASKGFYFTNPCGGVKLVRNEMQYNYSGLELSGNAIIGDQFHRGNTWTGFQSGTTSPFSMFRPAGSQGNKFYYDQNGGNTAPFKPDDATIGLNQNADNWFTPDGTYGEKACNGQVNGTPLSVLFNPLGDCSSPSPVAIDIEVARMVNNTDSILVSDTLRTVEYLDETNRVAKQQLYERLMNEPAMMDNNELFEEFYDNFNNEPSGELSQIASELENPSQAVELLYTNISNNNALIEQYSNDIITNESIGNVQANEILVNGIQNLSATNNYFYQLVENEEQLRMQYLRNTNQLIETTEIIDLNKAQVMEIYFQTLAADIFEFDTDQKQILGQIAHQCPQSGGEGVYWARNLYAISYPNEYYDDVPACLQQGYYRIANNGINKDCAVTSSNVYFSLAPNPANENFKLSYYFSEQENPLFVLYNGIGQKVHIVKLEINQKEQLIDCSNIESGIYFYKLSSDKGFIQSGKITILNK